MVLEEPQEPRAGVAGLRPPSLPVIPGSAQCTLAGKRRCRGGPLWVPELRPEGGMAWLGQSRAGRSGQRATGTAVAGGEDSLDQVTRGETSLGAGREPEPSGCLFLHPEVGLLPMVVNYNTERPRVDIARPGCTGVRSPHCFINIQ